jgi:hypothetical protein
VLTGGVLLLIAGTLGLWAGWQKDPWLAALLAANFAAFVWRALVRFAFTVREYGAARDSAIGAHSGDQRDRDPCRARALLAYVRTLRGEAPRWDKTFTTRTRRNWPCSSTGMRDATAFRGQPLLVFAGCCARGSVARGAVAAVAPTAFPDRDLAGRRGRRARGAIAAVRQSGAGIDTVFAPPVRAGSWRVPAAPSCRGLDRAAGRGCVPPRVTAPGRRPAGSGAPCGRS